MRKISAKIGVTALSAFALFAVSIPQAYGADFVVNCNTPKGLQDALDQARDGDTIKVVGGSTCLENIVVKLDHVTLDGNGTATIDGSGDPASPTVRVIGLDVTIKGFTILGGDRGIRVGGGGSAVIEDNLITGAEAHGVSMQEASYAVVRGNTITQNGNFGVNVRQASGADIINNTISANDGTGVRVGRGSHADIDGGNQITSNGGHGVLVDRQSAIDLSNDGVANIINSNTRNGVRCARSSSVVFDAAQNFTGGNGSADISIAADCDVAGP